MAQTFAPPQLEREEIEEHTHLYHVVLLDDDQHTYEYVVEMLQRLFVKSHDEAYRHACEVDATGRTVVITCDLLAAEFSRDQIHAYGPDWRLPRSVSSMKAILEPAAGPEVVG